MSGPVVLGWALLLPAAMALLVTHARSARNAFHVAWATTVAMAVTAVLGAPWLTELGMRGLLLLSLLGTVVVLSRPASWRDPRELGAIVGTTALAAMVFVARDLDLAALAWLLSFGPALWRRTERRVSRRPLVLLALVSGLPVVAGVALLRFAPGRGDGLAYLLLMVGAGARMGLLPFGPLVMAILDRQPVGRATLMVALRPSVPLALLAAGLVPEAAGSMAAPLVWWGAVAAFAGGLLGIVQADPRRGVAAIAITQAGIVFAALAAGGPAGIEGARLQWVGLGLGLVGLALIVESIEARLGRGRARRARGMLGPMPGAALLMLVSGATVSGFPGTVGFVGEDLVLSGALGFGLAPALLLLGATALNGVTVLRLFAQTFLGPPAAETAGVPGLVARERFAQIPIAVAIVLASAAPQAVSGVDEVTTEAHPR